MSKSNPTAHDSSATDCKDESTDEPLAEKNLGPSHSRVTPKPTWLVENIEPEIGEVFNVDGVLGEVRSVGTEKTILDTEDENRELHIPTEILLQRFQSVPKSIN